MANGRGRRITRGAAVSLGVVAGLGGLGVGLALGFFGIWSGASAAAYPWPGDAAAAEAVVRAALVCLIAGVVDLAGAVPILRGAGQQAIWPYRIAGGAFAVAGALALWAAATATHVGVYAPLGIAAAALALITPWWGRWPPR
jgi:hypothetical protein